MWIISLKIQSIHGVWPLTQVLYLSDLSSQKVTDV